MIILNSTTKSLQFILGGSVTTNQLPFSCSYVDITTSATTPGETDGVSNNATAVTLAGSPAASTERMIKNITIQNADTVSATVTIIYNDNSTLRNIFIATLISGYQIVYEDGAGWAVYDTNGVLKTGVSISNTVTPSQGGTGLTTLTSHAVMLGEGTANVGFAPIGTSGRLLIDQGASADPAFEAMSGDATIAANGAIAVTKTGGVAFAASATTDTTNASNISSGTIGTARLPLASSSAFGAVKVDGTSITASSGIISTSATPGLVRHSVNLLGSGGAVSPNKSAAWTIDELIVETALGGTAVKVSNLSLSFNGSTTGTNGMDTGSFPTSTNLYIYAIYNGTTVSTVGTVTGGGSIYSGSNMPAGYTYSALIWSGVTTISPTFTVWAQYGNRVSMNPQAANTSPFAAFGFTTQSVSTAVPNNATSCSGLLSQNAGSAVNVYLQARASNGTTGDQQQNDNVGVSLSTTTYELSFRDILVTSTQTIQVNTNNTSATANLSITGYTF